MADAPDRRTDELRDRDARHRRAGLLVSLLLHLLVLWVFGGDRVPPAPFSAAGPRAGDDRAAAAGGAMQAVQLRPLDAEAEIERPPEPEPLPAPEMTIEEPEQQPEIRPVEIAAFDGLTGRDDGPDRGPGLEEGEGEGDDGAAEEGLHRAAAPVPRGMIMPPGDKPDEVRGKEVEVWVFVTRTGRVAADSTRLRPPTGNSSFDKRLKEQAAQWVFEPAREGGEPVGRWFQYVITL